MGLWENVPELLKEREGREGFEDKEREAKIAVEEVPSTDAMWVKKKKKSVKRRKVGVSRVLFF